MGAVQRPELNALTVKQARDANRTYYSGRSRSGWHYLTLLDRYGRPYPSSSPPRGSRVLGRSESHPGQQHSSNVDDRATDSPHPFAPFVPSQQTPTAIFDPSLDSIHTPTDHAVDTLGSSLELGTWLPDAFPLSWPCDQPDGNLIGPSGLNDSNSAPGTGNGSGSAHDARYVRSRLIEPFRAIFTCIDALSQNISAFS